MDEKYIVAIDLGTFKISLAVALQDGTDTRLVYYKETPANGMKSSRILTELRVVKQLKQAIQDAEEILGIKITCAVVGMPRFYIKTEENEARIDDRDADSYITAAEINELKSFAQDSYPIAPENQNTDAVYGAIAQSFSTEEEFQLVEEDIVGMSSKVLEGSFKIFIGAKAALNRIDKVMRSVELVPVKKYFQPKYTADTVLYPSEMNNGVALIDLGGGCTSVSVFYKNVLRHYASIPFGGMNVTRDIQTESNISLSLAENLKLAFGACLPDKLQNMSEKQLLIKGGNGDMDRRLAVKYLSEIITAREEEIIRAMLYEIGRSGFADKLQSGVVITGGGAMMTNLGNFITELSGYKVRIGRPRMTGIINACTGATSPSASAVVGMIMAAVNEDVMTCACVKEDYVKAEDVAEDVAEDGEVVASAQQEAVGEEGDGQEHTPTDMEHKTGTLPGIMTEEEISRQGGKSKKKKDSGSSSRFIVWTNKLKKKFNAGCDTMLDLLEEDKDEKEE